jgi:copper homeostasis protein CutC
LRFTTKLKEKLERAFNNGHDRIEICMSEAEGLSFLYDALRGYENLPKNTTSKPRRAMEKVEDFI